MAEANNNANAGSESGVEISVVNVIKSASNPGEDPKVATKESRNQKANTSSSTTSASATAPAPAARPDSFLQRILQRPLIVNFAMWWGLFGAPMALMIFLARFVPPTVSLGVFLGLFFATVAIIAPLWVFVLFWPTARMQRYFYCSKKLGDLHRIFGAMFAGALLYSFGPSIGAMEINEGLSLQFLAKESNFFTFEGYEVNRTVTAEIYREPGCIDGPGLFAAAAPLVSESGPTRWAAPSCLINLASESTSVFHNCYYDAAVDQCKDSARELLTSNYNKELASLESLPTGLGLPLLIGFPMADNKDVGDMSAEIAQVFGVAPPSASQLFDPRASKDDIRDLGEHARTVSDALTITIILVMFLVPFLGFKGTDKCWYQSGK